MDYCIGVDGGGTKTAVCAAGQDSSIQLATTGSASWREYGIETVVRRIKEAIASLSFEPEHRIAGIAAGIPCYGESEDGERMLKRAFLEAFPDIPLYLTNDVEVGWAGSLAMNAGVNVVAGTGSIAYGQDQSGNSTRCGGWSEFFSDEGSCYWIGRKVMELFSKQSDGRVPKDALYDTVRSEFGLKNDFDFIDLMHNDYIGQRDRIASLQLLAEKAALAGSSSASLLYKEAVAELIRLVTAVKNTLNFSEKPFRVSCSGGLFKAGDLIIPEFRAKVEESGGALQKPAFTPAEGALLLAFRHFCPENLSSIINSMQSNI